MTINLITGEEYEPRREDYITKIAPVAPHGDCPLWKAFLQRVTGEDRELQLHLQRVAGYCLTGHTFEHAMFFLHGTGSNGKGTFVGTLASIWGDYHVAAPMEAFVETKNDRHETELAMLRGARLVTATETNSGRRWNEARIKVLTGGDPISARFMRGDYFQFIPQFKLMISGNHKPSLRNVDEAIRRRLHLIPFTVTIPKQDRDLNLAEKLKPEWPGILQWAVEGCLEWRRIGLSPPKAVLEATEDYLNSEDDVGTWLAECCEMTTDATARSADLYKSWKAWAERTGLRVDTQKRLSQALQDKGFEKKRESSGVIFFGLSIIINVGCVG